MLRRILLSIGLAALLVSDLSQAGAVTQPNPVSYPRFEQGITSRTEATNSGLTGPAAAVITDVAITETLPFTAASGDVVPLALGPRDTRVLQVSGGVASPTPTPTPSPTATPTATPTPPASQCVGDANANGIGDVVDIMTTASDLPCYVYLPLVVAQWHQPWSTPTPTLTPTPTAAQKLLSWLRSLPNRNSERLISGQHLGFGEGVESGYQKYVAELHAQTEEWVGMVGADYGYGKQWDESQGHWDLIGGTNPTLIDHWNRGGLVTISWHAPNPWTRKSAWDRGPNDDLTALVDPADPMNAIWEADLDRVALALKDLQDAGVVVLWRPFHESTGGWFWWGKDTAPRDPEAFKALWQHMHNYFTYHWGLDNLLWVYAPAESTIANTLPPETNYPGDAYVDVVGESHYRVGGRLGDPNPAPVNPSGYAALTALGKPYCLSEFGPNLQEPQGTYDYTRLVEEIRAKFPLAVCWYSWGDGGQGDARRAIVSNQKAAETLTDPWVITVEDFDWRQPWPTPTPTATPTPVAVHYPRLQANLFSRVPDDEAAYDALSRYGAVTTGIAYSDGSAGGYDLGVRQGVGSWSDTTYDLSHPGRGGITQVTVYEAKKRNPNLTIFAHRGLEHIEASHFGYGTNSPQRWFIDRLSPRWFAYTPLIQLQEPVTKTSTLTFQFRPEDVQRWRDWGVQGGDELGLDYWHPGNRYDWYYLSFFDNEAGAGRGTVEIMAIQSLDAQTGKVMVAVKFVNGKPKRAIYGRPQRYEAGSRAGIVPHSSESFGSPAFLMNRWCRGAQTPGCYQIVVDGVDWVDAAAEYVTEILMPSRYPLGAMDETWLVGGVIMDADDESWKPYGFRLADPAGAQGYHLDLNLDGQVDDLAEVNARLPAVYGEYARRLKEAAAAMERDFYVIINGRFQDFPRPYHNGRRYEDFNGGFEDTYPEAVTQYVDLFAPGNLDEPVFALISERDRNALYEHNFDQHRHIMALTLVLGDGFYGHDGAHATRIEDLNEDGLDGQPEDWFDEFSVDPYGYAADHPLYTGSGRSDYLGWLGRALGPGYEVPDVAGVYRRDFEHGIALYSAQGGTVQLDPPMRRICGVDPGNDGSLVTEITLAPRGGVILRRDENTGPCQAGDTLALAVAADSDLSDLTREQMTQKDTVAYPLTTSLLSQTPTSTATATPTPTAIPSPTPTATTTATLTPASLYLPLAVANWPTATPPQECECAGPGECGATPTPTQTLSKLAMVEVNEYWIAYESPAQQALSLAWAGDYLWMADVFEGVFYKVQEGENGLTIVDTIKVRRDPFMQARDLTWDGNDLWSVHWGDLIRHDMTDPNLGPDLWINEGEIGAPNLHHLKAIAWDGEFIWSALDGTIHRHNKTDFEVAETFQVSVTFSPAGMSFQGGDLWVANRSGGFIDRLDSNNFTLLNRYSIVQQPFGLTWSDSNLWVYDWYTNRVYKILKLPETSLDPEDDYLTAENYTRPEGIIRGEVTWTRAGSPYVVNDLHVERGGTLTIEPGATVYIEGESPISIEGVLNAVGAPDSEIVFTHEKPNQVWGGLYFSGEEANASTLEHVRIQYADDGIKGVDAAPHRIAYSVIRKVNVYGLRFELGAGDYGSLEIIGNRIEQGAGGGMKMILRSPTSRVDHIAIRENTFRFWYTAGPIIESEVQELVTPPSIMIEHNIFEHGYRGVGGGFPAVGNVIYRHNYLGNSVSGSGVQPFHAGNEITNNLIEYTFEAPYQLHPGHYVRSTVFQSNTVRGPFVGFDHNWGDPTIVVEQNNLLAPENLEFWASGIGSSDGGYDAEMRRNWWGTADLDEIRTHIFDKVWIEQNDPENTDVMGAVWIEPVLAEPNGIGFIWGRVMDRNSGRLVRSATITLNGEAVHSSANGEFFTSASQGSAHLTIESPEHVVTEYDVRVCSGTVTDVTVELEREAEVVALKGQSPSG